MLHEEQFANLTPLHRAAQKQPQELNRHKEVMQKKTEKKLQAKRFIRRLSGCKSATKLPVKPSKSFRSVRYVSPLILREVECK